MPQIQPTSLELVAQDVANGMTVAEAMKAHGYTDLRAGYQPKVKARVAELLEERRKTTIAATQLAQAATGITKEMVLAELWDNAMKAKGAKPVLDKEGNPIGMFVADFNASTRALQLVGMHLKMFVAESTPVQAGMFDNWQSDELRQFIRILDSMEQARAQPVPVALPVAERVRE